MKKVLILSDFYRGSYRLIGDFYESCLREFRDVSQAPTPTSQKERNALNCRGSVVLHNTLGDGFVPIRGCYNVAMPLHEWSEYPRQWIENLNLFDEIWTSTNHIRELLQRGGLKVPSFLLPPALDDENFIPKNNWEIKEKPSFLFVGESHFRKGNHLLIDGYIKAFPNSNMACLTIKTSPNCPWDSPREDIIVIKEDWNRNKLLAEYSHHDCFVSASLGEGLGLPIAEAIMSKLPICTNFWGGHKSLLTAGGFIEIPHEEIIQPFTSDPAFYAEGQKCAFSSPVRVKKALRQFLKTSLTERKEITQIAKINFLQMYGRENAMKNIESRLEKILNT
ncbi:MAG: glycosyltransferase [Verrucomicrobiota bacterium]|nr:glycosyltransferase [Verrucomicrobiota bacterium]